LNSGKEGNILKNKNLLLFVTNDFVTALGNSIFTILIMWYVYDVTGLALATAIIGSFTHISRFFAGPVAGVFADRSKKPLSLLKWALRINGILVVCMIISIYTLSGNGEIWAIFILVALREITFSLENPAQTRIMPMLVPVDSVSRLIGYRSVSSNIASLLGNSISGFLIAVIGITGGLIFNSVTFFIGAFIISFVHLLTPAERQDELSNNHEASVTKATKEEQKEQTSPERHSFKKDLIEGFKYLWKHEYIRKVTIIASLVNITSMIMPMFVVYFNEFLDSSPQAYGIFNAVLTMGSILSGLVIGKISQKFKNATIVGGGWLFLGIILLFMFVDFPIWVTYLFGLLLGIGVTLPSITLDTVQILIVPDEYRGRVHTIMQAIAVVLIPLSNLIGGLIADGLGANYVFLFAGIWQFIIVFIVFLNRNTFNTSNI